jgi:FMN phosphatase YigB (HAD superfamily)
MVGDDLTNDVHPSQALGIRPIWIDRAGVTTNGIPARKIHSLCELADALEGNNGKRN